ncbi:serine hydrolase [Streptosporangium sp. 'caverna']|uniref:serine hydrolase domain-containing protein n=1 Tax=Streptosporangium sp. 'caverna' TaxID=2202249 RepID=UPI000D7D3B1F|nr:serine hydrolase domain-containing protein [Streptosporangium sp. 'caverna']AWS47087.1 serine hydrolase [Streptosporangium sp. 'caverna']
MLLELITALVLATTPVHAAQPPELPGLGTLIDEHVTTAMAEEKVPGVAVTVVAGGKQVVDKGYGLANVERGIPVDPRHTRFLIGSETKLFTAQAALQLVHEGKLDLDADVNTYLTTFKIRDTYPGRPVTLRNLLTHTAGFDEDHVVGSGKNVRPLGEALAATQPARLRPPGTGVSYSNYGVALAGYLVETVSRMPFGEYVKREVFAPLGMKDSAIACGGLEDTGAYLVDGSTTSLDCADFTASGAGPTSTASDMGTYMLAQLSLDPRLGPGVAGEMQRRQYTEDPRLPGMGFMWEESPYKGHRMLFKGGDMPGMHSYMFLLPEQGIGIHIMSNGDGTGRHGLDGFELAEKIMDRYLPGAEPPSVQALSGVSAEQYEGWYQSSRTSQGSIMKVQALTDSPVHVTATADGGILTTGLKGGRLRWIQFEPGVFQEEGGWDRIAFPEPGQLAISRATVVFDRIGLLRNPSLHLALLAAALLVSLVALLGFPVAAISRSARRRSSPPAGPRVPRLLAWLASALVVVFVAGFGGLLADEGRALPLVLQGAPVLIALLVLSSLTVPLAAALLACTAMAWWKRWWRRPGRIAYTIVALGITAFAVVAVTYNLVGPPFT